MKSKLIEKKVLAILAKQLKKRGLRQDIKRADSLIGPGILDSLSAIELTAELEKLFSITIAPEEMTESNFDTIEKVRDFIAEKTNGK